MIDEISGDFSLNFMTMFNMQSLFEINVAD